MTNKSTILMASLVSLLTLSACHKDSHSTFDTVAGPVAATVNGMPISETSVDQLVQQRVAMGQPDSPELRKSIIDKLAMQALVAQEATKKNLDKSPDIINQINLTDQSILANAFVQDYVKNNPISDDTLKSEYDKIKSQMSNKEYKARHILVANESEAMDIIARLKKNPAQFDQLAKQNSQDTGSKDKGGELGWFDPKSMVPEFSDAVVKLQKGQITTQPVKTQFGYHIILLEDTRTKEVPPFDQVKDQLTKQLQEQNLRKMVDDMMAKAKVEITAATAASSVGKN